MRDNLPASIIRPITKNDEKIWQTLFRGYCDFYKVPCDSKLLATVWGWLMDEQTAFYGLVATAPQDIATPIALVHYRPFLNSLFGNVSCFVDDLFVSPDGRGQQLGRNLLLAVKAEARKNGWASLTWLTADNNYRARPIYDAIATRTSWVAYEMNV